VLEDRKHHFLAIEQRMAGPIDVGGVQRVHDAPIRLAGERLHDVSSGPFERTRVAIRFVRIDATCEERFETRVDAGTAKRLLHKGVEAEPGEMALVEHHGVPQRDRLTEVRRLR